MNIEDTLRKTTCVEEFWNSLREAITAAGGTAPNSMHDFSDFTLKEVANLYAQNGIRFYFSTTGTMSAIPATKLLKNALTIIEHTTKDLTEAKTRIKELTELHNKSVMASSRLMPWLAPAPASKTQIAAPQYPKYLWRKSDGERFTLNEDIGLYTMDNTEMKPGYTWHYNDLMGTRGFSPTEFKKAVAKS